MKQLATAYKDPNKCIIRKKYADDIIKLYNMTPIKQKYLINYYDRKRVCYPIEKILVFDGEYNYFIDKRWLLLEAETTKCKTLINCLRDHQELSEAYMQFRTFVEKENEEYFKTINRWTLSREDIDEFIESVSEE